MVSGEGIGYVCAALAVVLFGSNFIPVKQYEAGDGVFFQVPHVTINSFFSFSQ